MVIDVITDCNHFNFFQFLDNSKEVLDELFCIEFINIFRIFL